MRYVYIKNGNAVDQVRRLLGTSAVPDGGPDAFIGDFLLSNAGHEITVLCRADKLDSFCAGSVRAKSVWCDGSGALGVLRRGLAAVRMGIEIYRARPERILCGCLAESFWVAVLVSRVLRVPIVHSRHNQNVRRRGIGRIAVALDRICTRACIGVVCHGPFLRDQVVRQVTCSQHVFEFEVDLRNFRSRSHKAALPASIRTFGRRSESFLLFVGRIIREKGVFDLAEAFAGMVRSGMHDLGIVVAGDGPDSELLDQELRRLGIQDKVLLLGRVEHQSIAALINAAIAVVAPTRPELGEGRCMAALEALVLGVPVVAPELGGFPYVITNDKDGLLFEAGCAYSLEAALTRLINEDGLIARLRRGAADTAEHLLAPSRSFSAAVAMAFDAGRQ